MCLNFGERIDKCTELLFSLSKTSLNLFAKFEAAAMFFRTANDIGSVVKFGRKVRRFADESILWISCHPIHRKDKRAACDIAQRDARLCGESLVEPTVCVQHGVLLKPATDTESA